MPPGLLPPLLHSPSQRTLSPSISLQTKAHCRKQGVNLRDPAEVLEMAWDGWSGGGRVERGRTGETGEGVFRIKAGHQLEPACHFPSNQTSTGSLVWVWAGAARLQLWEQARTWFWGGVRSSQRRFWRLCHSAHKEMLHNLDSSSLTGGLNTSQRLEPVTCSATSAAPRT